MILINQYTRQTKLFQTIQKAILSTKLIDEIGVVEKLTFAVLEKLLEEEEQASQNQGSTKGGE